MKRSTPIGGRYVTKVVILASFVAGCMVAPFSAIAQSPNGDEYPPFDEVTKGYEKVVSTIDGKPSYYTLWVRKKDNQVLAELPKDFAKQRQYIALTVASGESFAGLQVGEQYAYWRQYHNRLALIEPQIATRSTGDAESKASVERLFTDRVLLDVPIVTRSPQGMPVIDMDALLVGQAGKFFPGGAAANPRLAAVKTAKAFPQNIELAFEVPMAGGRLKTLHYSISSIPDNTGYTPREADQRVGYFTTAYNDLGKYDDDDKRIRYINRWHLQKADPSLKMSPPKEPIVFYIEHTTPKRYRYWVKQGILYWNKAFERVGIRDAIVVYQQDADPRSPSHMEKDPEDVRYNFVRWLNNDVGTAIGPSRVHPLTGQILDADIILTDGWIRHYEQQFSELLPQLATEGFSPETLAWLNAHPQWDPRVTLAPPAERPRLLAERARRSVQSYGGHPVAQVDPRLIGDNEYDGLIGRTSQVNGLCLAADGKALDLAILRTSLALLAMDDEESEDEKKKKKEEEKEEEEEEETEKNGEEADDKDDEEADEEEKDAEKADEEAKDEEKDEEDADKEDKEEEQMLDGVPERFIGPLLAELVAHEVGHTLGLRHNFKGSSIYTFEEINSGEIAGKPHAGSVMDYLPINFQVEEGEFKGDHTMVDIGPYDLWAIEYGYTFDKSLDTVLKRVAEPEVLFGTDEDTWGPDPRARRYDFSANPIEYAKSQMKLAKYHRERLLEKFVEDGESWDKARRGYEMTLALQIRSLSIMADWVGAAFLSRDKKGDPNAREPIEVVPADKQREALQFCIENAFQDEAFGLTPDLLRHLAADQWLDGGFFRTAEADWPVHDRILGMQGSTLTMLMSPDTLRLVYDNELRAPADEDVLTLPELLEAIDTAIWTEVGKKPESEATARNPRISSLRRNLQREHLERLIDLTMPDAGFTAAYKPISNLALMRLRKLQGKIEQSLTHESLLDAYTLAHLGEAKVRIEKALDAQYIYNADSLGGGSSPIILRLGNEE